MPLVREIGRYIYRAHIHETGSPISPTPPRGCTFPPIWYFATGGASATPTCRSSARGPRSSKAATRPEPTASGRQLAALFNLPALRQAPARQPLVRDVWLPGIQVMAARRKEGSPEGFYLAAHGGHNAESHNHNDVGNFIVYCDGQPVIIDVGVETYTAKTFSSRRYEIWTMQSAYHNLPTVNGVMQGAGYEFAARDVAYRADDSSAQLSFDIAGAYPPEAGLQTWKRTLRPRSGGQRD